MKIYHYLWGVVTAVVVFLLARVCTGVSTYNFPYATSLYYFLFLLYIILTTLLGYFGDKRWYFYLLLLGIFIFIAPFILIFSLYFH